MSNCCKLFLNHLSKWGRTIFRQFEILSDVKRCKMRTPKFSISSFDWNSSSFASKDVADQLKQVFKLIDANGDGKLSSLELSEMLLRLGHKKSAAKKEAEKMVRELDCSGDGYIDFEAFMDAVGNSNVIICNDKEYNYLMDAFLIFDSDKNGFISAKDLQRVLISLGYDKCNLNECLLMIKGVGKDGDGLINFPEFKAMMTT